MNQTPNAGGFKAILSVMMRKILFELNISDERLSRMISKHINDPANGYHESGKDISGICSNSKTQIIKAMHKNNISWTNMFRAFSIMRFKRVKITFEITHSNDEVTVHKLAVNLEEIHDRDTSTTNAGTNTDDAN